MPQIKPEIETFAKIKVIGVGGGGGNAISRMASSGIKGVNFVSVNTDVQALHNNKAKEKIHIGKVLTRGLGAGMNPDIGLQAAEENKEEIKECLKGTDMVFITGGLGGGTGTGAMPLIAELARETGTLTVGVVTKPFSFEGVQRTKIAEDGLLELKDKVDTLIVIPNDRLLNIIDKKISLLNAFEIVDDVLKQAVQGISDLIVQPGIINLDFADIKAVMQGAGPAIMGIGRASGEDRAQEAARAAISSPLLEFSIEGAKGILLNVSGGADIGMIEISEAAKIITESADPDAKVIFGAVLDDKAKKGEIKLTVIATGFGENYKNDESQSLEEEKTAPLIVEVEKKKKKDKKNLTDYNSPYSDDEWDIPAFIRKKGK
jgi:cell division protein FtsZ